jgi:rhodanese-related sulfurtransferase
MRLAGIGNVHALRGGFEEWVRRGGHVTKGDKP